MRNRAKWSLVRIAEAVFVVSKHSHDHQEMIVKRGGTKTKDERVIALLLLYQTILNEISVADATRISQNKVAAIWTSRQGRRQSLYLTTFATMRIRYVRFACLLFST